MKNTLESYDSKPKLPTNSYWDFCLLAIKINIYFIWMNYNGKLVTL